MEFNGDPHSTVNDASIAFQMHFWQNWEVCAASFDCSHGWRVIRRW